MPIQKVYTVIGAQKAIASLPKHLQQQMRKANDAIAKDIARGARGAASVQGGLAARVGRTIKSRPDRLGPVVQMGSDSTRTPSGRGVINDVWGGAEFGGQKRRVTPRGGSTMQFRPWRGNQHTGGKPGYFLYPTVRDQEDEAMDRWTDALQKALDSI